MVKFTLSCVSQRAEGRDQHNDTLMGRDWLGAGNARELGASVKKKKIDRNKRDYKYTKHKYRHDDLDTQIQT